MRKGNVAIAFGIIGLSLLFLATGMYAGTEVQDVIKMENKAYKKHKRRIVEFSHKKHQEDYAKSHPDFYKNGCGECHHDKDNKPLTKLKAGDNVQGCIECHKKPAVMPSAEKKKIRKLSKKEKKSKKLEYHAEAVMMNCTDCHKKYNRKNKLKSKSKGYAPATCTTCHKKK
jgi:hypothetical protein